MGWERIVAIIDAAAPVVPPDILRVEDKPKKKAARRKPRSDGTSSSGEVTSGADSSPSNVVAVDFSSPPSSARESGNEKAEKSKPQKRRRKSSAANKPGAERMGEGAGADSLSRSPQRDGDEENHDAGDPPLPRAFGFSVEDLNREFALVLMGSKAVVFFEQPKAMIEDQKRMLSLDALGAWFANRFTERVASNGKVTAVTWAKAWLQSRQRRSYRGIEFFPDPGNAPGMDGYLNLWSGFAYKPAAKPVAARYKTFRDHLFNNVARGDDKIFRWVFGFFAHMMQRPRERLGVALVLRGGMGTGKTKVGEVFGALFPRHYFLVDDPRYVTGQFNAHMATCMLLQADEAVWAGDKAAEGRLKGLITSPIQQIEAKGVDPIRLPNYVRLIMTSNEEWVVPAGKDERRFAVLDVDPRCAQKHDYFREMDAELADGGFAHLLGDLLAFDLGSTDLRQVPRTEALLEQKIRSLDSVESWWFGRLRSGAITRHISEWRREIATATLFADYIATSEQIGVRRKQEETVFGIKIGRLLPGVTRVRRVVEIEDERGGKSLRRVWCYAMPELAAARSHFELAVNQAVEWPADDPVDADSGVGETDEVRL